MSDTTSADMLHDQVMQLPRFNVHTQEFDRPYRWYLRRRPRRSHRRQTDEPALTPFSLTELGLTPEEIEALGLGIDAPGLVYEPPKPTVYPPIKLPSLAAIASSLGFTRKQIREMGIEDLPPED